MSIVKVITVISTVSSSKPTHPASPNDDDDDDDDKEHTHKTTTSSSSAAPTSSSAPVVDAIELDTSADGVIEEEIIPLPPSVASENFSSQGYRRKRSLRVGTANFDTNGTLVSVPVFGLPAVVVVNANNASPTSSTASAISNGTGAVNLSATCVRVLEWPLQKYVSHFLIFRFVSARAGLMLWYK